ncbi:MAG: 4Fe-4S binding protein [Christensenellales bacterium]|nr:4Fe-4S binding protein [Christensenellales bacterium]
MITIFTRGGMDMTGSRRKRKAVVAQSECVACGCCVKVCPIGAIEVIRGLYARVNGDRCVGCGRCAKECPASVIEIREESV